MPTLDGNSFPDISPLLIHDEGVANLLSSLDDHNVWLACILFISSYAQRDSPTYEPYESNDRLVPVY